MRNTRSILVFLCFLGLIAFSCSKDGDTKGDVLTLWATNNSGETVSTFITYSSPSSAIPDQQDRLLPILANATEPYTFFEKSWDDVYKLFPNDTLSFFVFKTADINNLTWPVVRSQRKFLKHYTFTKAQLEAANYRIVYP